MDIYSTNKVIGVIEQELSEKHVRIKVVALKSDKGEITKLSEQDALRFFPPKGYIFEPGFFMNFKFQRDEVITFHVDQNARADGDLDKFRIHPDKHQGVKSFGHSVRIIKSFAKKNLTVDLSLLSVDGDTSDGEFWGITDKYIIEKLRLKNGKLEAAHHNRIKVWDRQDSILIEHKKTVRIEKLPQGNAMVLDCMDDKQLFEWFRAKLKAIDFDYVQMFDLKAKWREEIPQMFPQLEEEQKEVDQIRFKRIEGKFNTYRFSFEEIKTLSNISTELKNCFEQSIANYKDEMQKYFTGQLEAYQNELAEKAQIIDMRKSEIDSLQHKTQQLIMNINELETSKTRILKDFSIIKDVLQSDGATERDGEAFVMQFVQKDIDSLLLEDHNQIISRISFQLGKQKLNSQYASRLLEMVTVCHAFFVKDIRLGIAFACATGNARYVIQQVEPDWLRFKDFWHNGLGALWKSAHSHPEQFHFLLLQDINLASPECYARPLLDSICGVREQIPFGKTKYPNNLWIIATKASTEHPKIGLPLIESSFPGWGAIGYKDGLRNENKVTVDDIMGFFTPLTFSSFKNDDAIEETEARIKSELKKVFDEPVD